MSTPTRPSDYLIPKTISVFKEGYSWDRLKRDAVSGLTVAMVAIPLSMAIAKASGASPDRGLVTAIIGGFLISLLGGSRFQIGGPAGAGQAALEEDGRAQIVCRARGPERDGECAEPWKPRRGNGSWPRAARHPRPV